MKQARILFLLKMKIQYNKYRNIKERPRFLIKNLKIKNTVLIIPGCTSLSKVPFGPNFSTYRTPTQMKNNK